MTSHTDFHKNYPSLAAPKDGHVFVVTYGRSGSTLTQKILNAIPGYCIRGENANITQYLSMVAEIVAQEQFFKSRRLNISLSPEERSSYLRDIIGTPSDPWYGAELVDPQDLRLSLLNVFSEKILQLPPDCRVGDFKEIRQVMHPGFFKQHLDTIRTSFPNTKFIFQARNWEDVARSKWWANKPRDAVRERILTANRLFSEYQESHPEICFILEYEKYAKGATYVRSILDFLGENLSEESISNILKKKLTH